MLDALLVPGDMESPFLTLVFADVVDFVALGLLVLGCFRLVDML
jgi:hypothetical protein